MKEAIFTCAECGQSSPAQLVAVDELDRTPRHAAVVARAESDFAIASVRIERHVCAGSGRPPVLVVAGTPGSIE